MNALTIDPMRTLLCTALAAISCSIVAITPPSGPPAPPAGTAGANEAVTLTGWLHVQDLNMQDVVVTVRVNGEQLTGTVTESGRFDVALPADAEAVLRFEKPGHLAKEVVIDTRHADAGELGRKKRHVKFAVILELERWMGGLAYAGPVGAISFDKDGGCLTVEHKKEMVPARQRRSVMNF